MNTIIKRISVSATTLALLSMAAVPAAFADTVGATGNGAFSNSQASVSNDCSSSTDQSNNSMISNIIDMMLGNGGLSANFNTGGTVVLAGGNTSSTTNITNAGGSNADLMGTNGCGNGASTAVQAGNGAFSNNSVDLQNMNSSDVRQTAATDYLNQITTGGNSGGDSSASFNTGTNVEILPGSTQSQTTIWNQSGSNALF